jgi:hypothetical protein
LKNKVLYRYFDHFVRTTISLLASHLQPNYDPAQSFSDFVWRYEKEILQLKEYEKFIDIVHNDRVASKHFDKQVGTFLGIFKFESKKYLFFVLSKLVRLYYQKGQLDEAFLQELYKDLELFLYNENLPIVEIVPLYNFDSNISIIDLAFGLSIRKISEEEVRFFYDESSFDTFEIYSWRYVIEYKYYTKKIFTENALNSNMHDSTTGVISPLITSLRLFKSGVVGFNIVERRLDLYIHTGLSVQRERTFLHTQFQGKKYKLEEQDIPEFKKFWKATKIKLLQAIELKVGVTRFNYAYERSKPEDKLLDYAISFESLFSKEGEEHDSLTHKLATRSARLLENRYENRKVVDHTLRSFYRVRSQLVHGKDIKISLISLEKIEDYLRRSIRILIRKTRKESRQDVIERLDLE